MKNNFWIIIVLVLVAIVLGVFLVDGREKLPEGHVSGEMTSGIAVVDSIEVMMMESFPLQALARIKGHLPDGCTVIGRIDQFIEGDLLRVSVETERPTGEMCTEALVPYEKEIALDILGLPAGEYTVDINGVKSGFVLEQDNLVDFESDKGLR